MLLSTYTRVNPMSIEFISDRQTPWLSILQTAVTVNVTVQTSSPTGSLIMISQPYSYRYKPVQTKKKIACDKTFLDPDERRTLKGLFPGKSEQQSNIGAYLLDSTFLDVLEKGIAAASRTTQRRYQTRTILHGRPSRRWSITFERLPICQLEP